LLDWSGPDLKAPLTDEVEVVEEMDAPLPLAVASFILFEPTPLHTMLNHNTNTPCAPRGHLIPTKSDRNNHFRGRRLSGWTGRAAFKCGQLIGGGSMEGETCRCRRKGGVAIIYVHLSAKLQRHCKNKCSRSLWSVLV